MSSIKSFEKAADKAPEKQIHTVRIDSCSVMNLTGVNEVKNFTDCVIELITLNGGLTVKGKGLNMSKLNTDTGELNVNGDIHSIQYTAIKRKGSIIEGLFK